MTIMSIKAYLFIFVMFIVVLLSNCSIEDKMFSLGSSQPILEENINKPIFPKIAEQSTGCYGPLFCYISQLSPLNNEGNWKPSKAFELTKKGTSKLCQNGYNNDVSSFRPNLENLPWHGFIVIKHQINTVEIKADIFPEGENLFFKNITPSELVNFVFGNDESLKKKIINASQIDKEWVNSSSNLRPLFDEYTGILALKYDIIAKPPKNMQTKPVKRVFFWAHVNRCPLNEIETTEKPTEKSTYGPSIDASVDDLYKRNKTYEPHKLQLSANIYELGCLQGINQKVNNNNMDKQCKEIDKNYNKECEEEMWSKFTICYNSRLEQDILSSNVKNRVKLQNYEYSAYGRKCTKPGQHGLEMRVCARRISFNQNKNNYNIEYKVYAKIGFSYTYKSFSFDKKVSISGKINEANGHLEPLSKEDVNIPIFTIQLGNNETYFSTLTDLNNIEYNYSKSTIFWIHNLFDRRIDDNDFQSIADGNEAISLLGLDMDLLNNKSNLFEDIEFPQTSCFLKFKFNGKDIGSDKNCEIFYRKQNYVSNRIELHISLYNLACNDEEADELEKSGKLEFYETCKYISGNNNKMMEWNSINLTLCYKSQLGDLLKNNPKSNYAKSCDKKEKHGIEFQMFATRVGFNRYEEEEYYVITFRVDIIVGFSFSTKTLSFGKSINVTGNIRNPYKEGEPKRLQVVNYTEDNPLLFSIQFGDANNNFAILKDEINGNIYNFENYLLEQYSKNTLQEIAEKGGRKAMALVGPDINMKGELLSSSDFEIISVSEKSCANIIKLVLNNENLKKRFSCYTRPLNQCDIMGLEKYNELKNAFDKLMELKKKCPCKGEPRPEQITVDMLYLYNNNEDKNENQTDLNKQRIRNKRYTNDGITRDENGLIKGCENAKMIAFGDILLRLPDIERRAIQIEQKCCNKSSRYQSRKKRQLFANGRTLSNMLWKMPVYYTFPKGFNKDLKEQVMEALKQISELTCITFEKVDPGYNKYHILFMDFKGCGGSSPVGVYEGYSPHDTYIPSAYCNKIGTIIHETFHALGLHHEMVRDDRNDYVWIYSDNIIAKYKDNFVLEDTENYATSYDYGSIMHYPPYSGFSIEQNKFAIISLRREYQRTMGQRFEPSFKDVKLTNRIYCTPEYPHRKSSIQLNSNATYNCNPEEYELNKGKCKNGGYPDPLKNCKCRCPKEYIGNCEISTPNSSKLTATFKKQYIPKILHKQILIIKVKQQNVTAIPKQLLIKVEKVKGFDGCDYPCGQNFLEIKYRKDKSATGARICCSERIMPLIIHAEENTDVLIIKYGIKGSIEINYQLENVPTKSSNKCKEVYESIFHSDRHPVNPRLVNIITGKASLSNYGPTENILCTNNKTATVNGIYKIEERKCYYNTYCGTACGRIAYFHCMKVEGSDESNWYWKTPDGDWIMVSEWSCYKHKDKKD